MRAHLQVAFILLLCTSCIPLRIAPEIDDYRITKGRSFKRSLPKREMFVFEDPKDANQFYNYVDTKFELNNEKVYDDVPFLAEGQQFFFSFYEIEIPDKSINIFPIVLDFFVNAALGNEDIDPIFSDDDGGFTRRGHWYIAIEVYNDMERDCLRIDALSRATVLEYLRGLKKEYLSTNTYNETVFKN